MLLMISANIYTKIIAAVISLINRKYFLFLVCGTDWKLALTIDSQRILNIFHLECFLWVFYAEMYHFDYFILISN